MVSVPCQSVIGICHLVIMSKRYLDWLPSVTVLGEVYGMKENVPGGLVPLFQQVGSLFQQLGGPCSDRCSKFLTIIAHRGEGEGEGGRGVIQAAHSAYSSLQSSFLCPPPPPPSPVTTPVFPPEESTWIDLSRKSSSYSCNNELLPTLKSCSSRLLPLWFSWLHCASSKCSSPLILLAHYSNSTMLKR